MTTDAWRTEFGVQPFKLDRRRLSPLPVRASSSAGAALRLGEKLAHAADGVLVYSRRCAPDLGEYEDPMVLATHGQVPSDVLELARA